MKRHVTSHRRRKTNRNRIYSQTQHTWAVTAPFALFLIFAAVVCIVYAILQHNCESISEEIAFEESRQMQLDTDLRSEKTKWEALIAPASLESALKANGIRMTRVRQTQRIPRKTYYAQLQKWESKGYSNGSDANIYASTR